MQHSSLHYRREKLNHMRILFFEPYALALPHYETALELMQDHLNAGDEVYLYHCDANLSFCEANHEHQLKLCEDCISRRQNGLQLIDNKNKFHDAVFENLSTAETEMIANWNRSFENIDQLKQFTFEGVDIGMAVASSLISRFRNPEPDLAANQDLTNKIFRSALKIYFSFKRILIKDKPGLVYLFNGRFANLRVVMRLCEINGITFRIHERGANIAKYSIFENHLPHDMAKFVNRVHHTWNNGAADPAQRETIANDFYVKRKAGVQQSWFSFVDKQNQGELPAEWNPSKRNIIIFNSSEDEFAAIGDEFNNALFKNQLDGIQFITAALSNQTDIDIYLRIHPNLTDVNNASVQELYNIHTPNFHIIAPQSTISTYTLIDECNAVVTFGSTTGVEATYWNKPSILVGNTFYKPLGATYNPGSREQLLELIKDVSEVKNKEGALLYAYYLNTFGIDFKYYVADDIYEGKFKGVRIKSSEPVSKPAAFPFIERLWKSLIK